MLKIFQHNKENQGTSVLRAVVLIQHDVPSRYKCERCHQEVPVVVVVVVVVHRPIRKRLHSNQAMLEAKQCPISVEIKRMRKKTQGIYYWQMLQRVSSVCAVGLLLINIVLISDCSFLYYQNR